MRSFILAIALTVGVMGRHGSADEPAEKRTYWVYEGRWFSKSNDGTWHELNEPTFRKLGKPYLFKEVRRTPDFVELRDDGRKVEVRLMSDGSLVRLIDKPGAEWEALYKGRWKSPSPLE
ncbi:MAG: hypothetical protein FJ261_01995 [Planctomycetes bacterium]|nr:hypothetical protein [Planctomycetota bacterium]